jgi:hypothetical protein
VPPNAQQGSGKTRTWLLRVTRLSPTQSGVLGALASSKEWSTNLGQRDALKGFMRYQGIPAGRGATAAFAVLIRRPGSCRCLIDHSSKQTMSALGDSPAGCRKRRLSGDATACAARGGSKSHAASEVESLPGHSTGETNSAGMISRKCCCAGRREAVAPAASPGWRQAAPSRQPPCRRRDGRKHGGFTAAQPLPLSSPQPPALQSGS